MTTTVPHHHVDEPTDWVDGVRTAVTAHAGFAPPGDIHRVRNTSETTAISIHIYGTDITRVGSSARRYYD
jgi:predicted metal-dependent enzyme (double-stranded beta helix superfamily)